MTQPRLPLTFGVELEFGVGYLEDESAPIPEEAKQKIIHFPTTEEDYADMLELHTREDWLIHAVSSAAKRSVRNTIKHAGFNVTSYDQDASVPADVSLWEVLNETSISFLSPGPYEWTCMEVRSPAYYFTRGSLQAVGDVCKLLTRTYGMQVGRSMGLHVHVGNSNEGFDTKTLQKIVAFLWAFEPQLNSLHPVGRQSSQWASSMRETSPYARNYLKTHGKRPHPLTGAIHFLNCKTTTELVEEANYSDEYMPTFKFSAYNFQGMYDRAKGVDGKPTIEFRQHAGTLSSEATLNWIKTAVGIIDYIRHVDDSTLLNLLRIVENETWEKLGDGEDDERERTLGPILAESKFTISDLLTEIGLHGPAAYYKNRWIKLPKEARQLTPEEQSSRDGASEEGSEEPSEEPSEAGTNNSQPQSEVVDEDPEQSESEGKAESDKLDKELA